MSGEKLDGDTVNIYFDFLTLKSTSTTEKFCLGSFYFFFLSLQRQGNTLTYENYIGKKLLWEYINLMIPVHLPDERHCLLVILSVVNICLHIYDLACNYPHTYRSIFNIMKNNFIRQELRYLSSEERAIFQEENWEEKRPKCSKQKNEKDCFHLPVC